VRQHRAREESHFSLDSADMAKPSESVANLGLSDDDEEDEEEYRPETDLDEAREAAKDEEFLGAAKKSTTADAEHQKSQEVQLQRRLIE